LFTNSRVVFVAVLAVVGVTSCCSGGGGNTTPSTLTVLSNYHLAGAVDPVRDPSVIRQNNTYYAFSTDTGASVSGSLPISVFAGPRVLELVRRRLQ
jgi:hypothetical protein